MADLLTPQEKLVLALRELYESCGYTRFPMRRFEEYQLYLENKSFLTSERVLSFTDVSGKLMALKPDVTLSIVKHYRPENAAVEKLYYNESVYRASPTDHAFTEIEQIGVEMLGEVDLYGACEVLALAVQSLRAVGLPYVMELSHMGLTGSLMEDAALTPHQRETAFSLIRQKNAHELTAALKAWQIAPFYAQRIARLPGLSGEVESTLEQAAELAVGAEMKQAIGELSKLYGVLDSLGLADCLRLDFSIANDLDYYNGLVFQGYVEGAPRAVLSGGRYDRLMSRLGKDGAGLGFALYLDELTRLLATNEAGTEDLLVLYSPGDDPAKVFQAAQALRRQGARVLTATRVPSSCRAGKILRYSSDGLKEAE